MRRATIRALTSLIPVAGIVAVAAGCSGTIGTPPPSPSSSVSSSGSTVGGGTSPTGQDLFQVRLVGDDRSLDQGILGYQAPATMNTGANATLNVEVIDNGTGEAGTMPLPAGTGYVFARQDVPTGGIVGVHSSCQGVTCTADGPERQPVISSGMTAYWSWELSARNPGTARVLLVATTYDQGTSIPLHVTQPIEITITVNATPGYWVSAAGNLTKGVIGFGGVGTIVTGIGWLSRRGTRRAKPAGKPGAGRAGAGRAASSSGRSVRS
jgi:hypothetical protein